MPYSVEEVDLETLISLFGQNEREVGRELGWREASTFLMSKAGQLFCEGKDDEAKSMRDYAKVLQENAINSRSQDNYVSGIPAELTKRLEQGEEVNHKEFKKLLKSIDEKMEDLRDILNNYLDWVPEGTSVAVDNLRKIVKEWEDALSQKSRA